VKITPEELSAAERVLGVEFTSDERKLILESLPLVHALYQRRRAAELSPGLAPALRFDPRLPDVEVEHEQRPLVRSEGEPGAPPDRDEDLAFASISQLSGWLERGELSSTRLTGVALDRLRRLGGELECIVALTEERALEQAQRADREIAAGRMRGPLHGLPWGAKDLLDTRGTATTWGAAPFRGRVPERDAEVVRRLDEAGAVLVAKLSLGELAQGDVWFGGRTRNRGIGGRRGGRAGHLLARERDARVDLEPQHGVRRGGPAPELRPRAAYGLHGAGLVARQDRSSVSTRGRCGPRAGGDPRLPRRRS
jgi:hypothetical protein